MDELDRAFVELLRSIGKEMGIDDVASTIYALLYLEPAEITMEELTHVTGYSLASVSNKVRLLEHGGMIKRANRPGTRKVYLSMDKDYFRVLRQHLSRMHEIKIKIIKERLPKIILQFKKKKLTEKQKQKLIILEQYCRQVMRFDSILQQMIKQLESP